MAVSVVTQKIMRVYEKSEKTAKAEERQKERRPKY